ncbi:MAG: hypothetical protein KDB14_16965 [Planctomycetales bacterium]|nr:hypothetical protein [Planctomycetales bacterium]
MRPTPESNVVLAPHGLDLRNVPLAATLAWLIPGAGHIYQRRYAKGVLFSVCVLGTFFFGLAMGGGRVVYASVAKGDVRWHYICQLGVGLPAMPALMQQQLAQRGKSMGEWMRPPQTSGDPQEYDELAQWHEDYHHFFELGTLYTMVAGLLNVLAIYDAAFGPFTLQLKEEGERAPPSDEDADNDGGEDAS